MSSTTSNTVVVHVEFERWRFPPDVVNVKTALQPASFKSNQIPHAFHPSSQTTGVAENNNKNLVNRSEYSSSPYSLRKTAKNIGSQGSIEGGGCSRKPRFQCLHGFRTSGEIMRKQVGKWPESVLEKLDMVYLDGPFPAQGKSDIDDIFDPSYY
ncbi:hypothetical protein TB2_019333 [Malus domestica]